MFLGFGGMHPGGPAKAGPWPETLCGLATLRPSPEHNRGSTGRQLDAGAILC